MKLNFLKLKKEDRQYLDRVYDFLIIGSGPAAVTLCNELLLQNNKPDILMIERGDYIEKKFEDLLSNHIKVDKKSRSFTVGGTSSIWSSISSYFESFEMISRWQNKKKNLWPLKHEELIKYYKLLNKNYKFLFHLIKKKKYKIPFKTRTFAATQNPINFKKFIKSENIDLLYNCKIHTIDEKNNLTIAYQKNKVNFKSKKMILCCGGIESIRLVKKSIQSKKIINLKNKKLIGKYFMDHPKIDLGYLKYPKEKIIQSLSVIKKKNVILYQGISLEEKFQKKNCLLNTYVRFEKVKNKFFYILKKKPSLLIKNFINIKNIYNIRLFCEMIPSNHNYVGFKNNKTVISLRLNKIDYLTIDTLVKKIKFFFSHNPNSEDSFNLESIKYNIEDASHHMGGLRYYPNRKYAIVDKNLKIIGLKNTYVCSSAVFPTSGSVNPTLTICALGLRLARFLKKR